MIHIALRHFAQVSLDEKSRLLSLLTPEDQTGVARHPDRRERQLLARAWRRELLAKALNTSPKHLVFNLADHGKPFLDDHALSFNISHSHDAFVLAWCIGDTPLGTDIEDKNRELPKETLAKRYFHPRENDAWKNLENIPVVAHAQWLTTWTRKEAILKAHGMGIRIDLNRFNTETADECVTDALLGTWRYRSFELEEQVISVAWQGPAQLASPNTQ